MRKINPRLLLVVAVVLSLIVAGLTYSFLKKSSLVNNSSDLVEVVVAKSDIPARTTITASMITTQKYPSSFVDDKVMIDKSTVIGVESREFIAAGDVITKRKLNNGEKIAGFSGMIPPGKRAMSLAVDEIVGVSGLIIPGDFVDVVAVFDRNVAGEDVSRTVLRGVEVLAVNQTSLNGEIGEQNVADKKKADLNNKQTITIAVSPQDEAVFALLDERSKVRLALRPFKSETLASLGTMSTVDVRSVMNLPPLPMDNNINNNGEKNLPSKSAVNASNGSFNNQTSATNNNTSQPSACAIEVIRGNKVDFVEP